MSGDKQLFQLARRAVIIRDHSSEQVQRRVAGPVDAVLPEKNSIYADATKSGGHPDEIRAESEEDDKRTRACCTQTMPLSCPGPPICYRDTAL